MTDTQQAGCGCRFGTAGDAFWFEPCALDCDLYGYVQREAERQGKPVSTLDLRDVATHRLAAEASCPWCGGRLDAATGAGHVQAPSPGDPAVCGHCAAVLVFDDQLRHALPSEAHRAWLVENVPNLAETIEVARQMQTRRE